MERLRGKAATSTDVALSRLLAVAHTCTGDGSAMAARAGLPGSSPTVAAVSKAFFMWVGWMWSATVDSAETSP